MAFEREMDAKLLLWFLERKSSFFNSVVSEGKFIFSSKILNGFDRKTSNFHIFREFLNKITKF